VPLKKYEEKLCDKCKEWQEAVGSSRHGECR